MDNITRIVSIIGFGGGCHWCTEAVFQNLHGVDVVVQGFIASKAPHDQFSEAVRDTFNAAQIDLMTLMDIHLRTHASGSNHSMRGKYRSAIYVHGSEQSAFAQKVLDELQKDFETLRVTQVLELTAFKPSEPRFQNYYETGPDRPFCRTYIDPKLAKIRQIYGTQVFSRK
ncbi:MAG: peptide-methionine (S)-S-oxide reductase [Litorimonas sp.]